MFIIIIIIKYTQIYEQGACTRTCTKKNTDICTGGMYKIKYQGACKILSTRSMYSYKNHGAYRYQRIHTGTRE